MISAQISMLNDLITKSNSHIDMIIYQYLKNFEPATSSNEEGAYFYSTAQIAYDLLDFVQIEINDLCLLLMNAGFHFEADVKNGYEPGWIMKKV